MSTIISVNIQLDGLWPTAQELDARNAAIEELSKQKVGEFLGAGAGAGGMDFAFEVSEKAAAKAMISETVSKHLAGRSYSLESMPAKVSKDMAATNDIAKEQGKSKGGHKPDCGMKM